MKILKKIVVILLCLGMLALFIVLPALQAMK